MSWRRIFFRTPVIIILAISILPPVWASNYSIALNGNLFNVTWQLNAWQNLTSFSRINAFPANLSTTLAGSDLASFETALQSRLYARVPTISIIQPTLQLASNSANVSCSTSCPFQWFNVTLQVGVRENVPARAGETQYDMSWKSLRIDDDLTVGGIHFNTLGLTYLAPTLAPFVSVLPSAGRTMRVVVQNVSVSRVSYLRVTSRIVLFDMSPFQIQLEDWNHQRDLNGQRETWTSPRDGGFTAVATLTIQEPGLTSTIVYIASGRLSAEISAPLGSFAKGDILFVDSSNGLWDGTAAATVLASLGVLAVTLVIDRRLTGRSRIRRKAKVAERPPIRLDKTKC